MILIEEMVDLVVQEGKQFMIKLTQEEAVNLTMTLAMLIKEKLNLWDTDSMDRDILSYLLGNCAKIRIFWGISNKVQTACNDIEDQITSMNISESTYNKIRLILNTLSA